MACAWACIQVRIEHTTSATINDLFPGELTPVLTAGARRYLRAANHTGRMWNSAVSQVPHTHEGMHMCIHAWGACSSPRMWNSAVSQVPHTP